LWLPKLAQHGAATLSSARTRGSPLVSLMNEAI